MKYQKFPKKLLKPIILLLAIAMVFGAFSQSAKAQYQTGDWVPFGSETTIGSPEVKLLSADAESILAEAVIPGIAVQETELQGESYLTFNFEGFNETQTVGAPNLPVLNQLIEVPFGAEVSLEILEKDVQTIKLVQYGLNPMVAPVQPGQPKCDGHVEGGEPLPEYYQAGIYPQNAVEIVDEFIMRGHRIVHVQVHPARFNGSNGELETSSLIRFKLNLSGSDMAYTIAEADRLNSEPFNNMLKNAVMNYNQGRPVVVPNDNERILIITSDQWESSLNPLVELKESQGFTVSVVALSTVGGNNTDSIKNYIKTQYQGANPPDYVILIGDYVSGDGAGSLTNWPFLSGVYGARTDLHYFTMDSDTEFVPDILWGRFPVKSVTQLENMIGNLQWYNDLAGDEAWIKKAEFLASDDSYNYTVAERTHNYCIDNYTAPRNYTGIFPNNPQLGGDKIYAITYNGTGANAIASVNDDRSYIIYSGHGATTFWDGPRVTQEDIRNFTGVPMAYVASHACITADYMEAPESFGDTWVIQNGKGGLVFAGASVSTYWPPDETMEKAIFDHLYEDPTDEITPSISAMVHYGNVQVQAHNSNYSDYYWEAYQIFGDPSLQILKKPKFPDFRVSVDPTELKVCNEAESEVAVNLRSINEFADPVQMSASGMSGFSADFNPPAVTPPGNTTLTLTGDGTAPMGVQTVIVKGTSGSLVNQAELTLDVYPPIPTGATLTEPADGAKNQPRRPTFRWTAVANVESYTLQIAKDAAFTDIVHEKTDLTGNMHSITYNLDTDKVFYWRVVAINACGEKMSTKVFSFRTAPGPGDCPEGFVPQQEYFNDFEGSIDDWTIQPDPVNGNEWEISGEYAYSPTHAIRAAVPGITSDQRLESPFLEVPSSPYPVAVLFMHRWTFDANINDCNHGGVLEYSEDNGQTWKAFPRQHIILEPYNGTVKSGVYNPLGGRQAWCGSNEWTRTVLDMQAFAGKTISLRFRLGTGNVGTADGWFVDDFSLQTCVEGTPEEPTNEIYIPLVLTKE